MRKANRHLIIPLAGLLLLGGCEARSEKQQARTMPAVRAIPPLAAQADPAPAAAVAPPAPRLAEPPQPPAADPVDVLIARSEREYQAGLANHRAGHLEAAKENFDRAVNLLLESGLALRGDERLEQHFDKIVSGVYGLEMAALKEGDGFTQQAAEPAPIDEASELTFPVDPNVKAKAEEEVRSTASDIPLVINDYVASYINFFSSRGRGTLERALVRAGRYRPMIQRIFAEEGVPQDLIYLAQAESGFHPLAVSRVGARGMWQFMAGTAVGYALKRNWWVDDRQDPEKATRAAARHLKDLYNQFGDWYLAMAAYNSGAGNVQRGVRRTGYADFWELYKRNVLPNETKNYVPIIVAVAIMAKNPEQYGLQDLQPDPPLEIDRVKVNYPVDLRLVAECVDTTVDKLTDLNPSLLRMTTPKDGEFELKLPAGSAQSFETAIAAIPRDKRVLWRYHRVDSGENLATLARKYRTTTAAIAQVNSMEDGDELPEGGKLIIPVSAKAGRGDGTLYAKQATRYKVRKGDTVLSVADDFGIPPEKLRRWNGLRGNSLRAGRTLKIYRPVGSKMLLAEARVPAGSRKPSTAKQKSATGQKTHTVRPGDTLFGIASRYNVTVAQLQQRNRISGSTLRPGDVLVVGE